MSTSVTMAAWPRLAHEQAARPGTKQFTAQLTERLSQDYQNFGAAVTTRLPGCAYFASTTFAPNLQPIHSHNNAFVIAWVFALDNLLDDCPSFDYANDLQLLLNRRLDLPLKAALNWRGLGLAHDPKAKLPGLNYSLNMLVGQMQLFRQRLARQAADPDGLRIFDYVLREQVVPSMLWETRWRLKIAPTPSFDEYLAQGYLSICGNLCTATVNAILPHAAANWQAVFKAMEAMCYGCRLVNDGYTWPKERIEGKPNALGIMAAHKGEAEAKQELDHMVDQYLAQLSSLCYPYYQQGKPTDPLYHLNYYIYYVLVMTRAMYTRADFDDPAAH